VNVFRAPDALPQIARDTVAIGAGALWCQFGVINEEGGRIAEDGGVTVIMDRCLKVEHARFVGRMHWLGFNTRRITSVRDVLVDTEDEAHLLLIEKWESIEHDQAYRDWRATDAGASALPTIVASRNLTRFVAA
jgi:hypothetical protein